MTFRQQVFNVDAEKEAAQARLIHHRIRSLGLSEDEFLSAS
jgi:hypothetical protein